MLSAFVGALGSSRPKPSNPSLKKTFTLSEFVGALGSSREQGCQRTAVR